LVSLKILKPDGTEINLHSNLDGRRLRELRKVKKKKAKVAEAAPEKDNSPPVTVTELGPNGIKMQLNYGEDKDGLSRKDEMSVSLSLYMFEPAFEDTPYKK